MPASPITVREHSRRLSILGSGSAASQNMKGRDNAAAGVVGVKLGVTGGTGPMNAQGRVAGPGQSRPERAASDVLKPTGPTSITSKSGPKVQTQARVHRGGHQASYQVAWSRLFASLSSGAVQVLGVTSDLGHGLGDSAVRAVQATRFQPATDDSGHPTDWEGVVNVDFNCRMKSIFLFDYRSMN